MPKKSKKYVISLDEMDLGLLPTTYMADHGKVAPLWTKTNLDMRNNQFYEFEIKTTDSDIKETEKPNVLENIVCHLCDVEVPKPFMKQHVNSEKHDINVKITDIAMERMKKSLHNNMFCEDATTLIDPLVYFCTICVTVVNKNDKGSHEKSLLHKNSVIVDKFLHDFYLLYKNNDSSDNNVSVKNNSNNNYVDKICVKGESNNFSVISDLDIASSNKDNAKCIKYDENDSFNDINLTAIQNVIEIPNDSEIFDNSNVSNRNDCVFTKDMENYDSNDLNTTIESENEFLKVKTKKRGKRKNKTKHEPVKINLVDGNINKKATIPSTDIEKNNNFYPIFDNYKNLVTEEIVSQKEKVFEAAKEPEVFSHNNDFNDLNSNNEVKTCSNNANFGDNKESLAKNDGLYDKNGNLNCHLAYVSQFLCCVVCKIKFQDDREVVTHLNSYEHMSAYYDFLAEQCLLSDDIDTFCEVCRVVIKKEEEITHCKGLLHITKHEIYKRRCYKIY